jgi:hypothetical protein
MSGALAENMYRFQFDFTPLDIVALDTNFSQLATAIDYIQATLIPPLNFPGTVTITGATDRTALVIVSAVSCPGAAQNVVGLGVELGAQTTPDQWAVQVWGNGGVAPGCSNGVGVSAGTNYFDWTILLRNAPQTSDYFGIRGDGSGFLGPEPNQLLWDANGHFTLTGTATLPGGDVGPISMTLEDLTDVGPMSPAVNDRLGWNGARWINMPEAAGIDVAPFNISATVTNPQNESTVQNVLSIINPFTATQGINLVGPVAISPGNNWSSGIPLRVSGQVGYDCLTVYGANQTATSTVPPGPGDANYWVQRISEGATAPGPAPGAANGLKIAVGTVAGDTPFMVAKASAYDALRGSEPAGSIAMLVLGDMQGTIGPQMTNVGGVSFSWDTAGHFYIGSALLPGSASPVSTIGHGKRAAAPFTTTQTVKTISHTLTGPGWLLDLGGHSSGLDVPQTAGMSNGLCISMGTNAFDAPLYVMNGDGTLGFFRIRGDGSGWLGPSSTNCMTWDSGGVFGMLGAAQPPPAGTALSDVAPATPFPGELWFRTTDGTLAIWYDPPPGGGGSWLSVGGAGTAGIPSLSLVGPLRFQLGPAQGPTSIANTIYIAGGTNPGDLLTWSGSAWVAAPSASGPNLLPLNNTWSGTNIFNANTTFSGLQNFFSSGTWVHFAGALVVERLGSVSSFTVNLDGSGSIGPAPNMLQWDTAGHFTLAGTATLPGGGGGTLATLTDVALASPAAGQFLSFNGTAWANVAAPGSPFLQPFSVRNQANNADAISISSNVVTFANLGGQTVNFNAPVNFNQTINSNLTVGASTAAATSLSVAGTITGWGAMQLMGMANPAKPARLSVGQAGTANVGAEIVCYGAITSPGSAPYAGGSYNFSPRAGTEVYVDLTQADLDGQPSASIWLSNMTGWSGTVRITVGQSAGNPVDVALMDDTGVQIMWEQPAGPVPFGWPPQGGLGLIRVIYGSGFPMGSWHTFQ